MSTPASADRSLRMSTLSGHPQFPEFKELELSDRSLIQPMISEYGPNTSELTFTNLYIWRNHYRLRWSLLDDLLMIIALDPSHPFAFMPIGSAPRIRAARTLLRWFEGHTSSPRIERADERFIRETRDHGRQVEPQPEHFDYVYRSADLAELSGRKYHAKRNFASGFFSAASAQYVDLTPELIDQCLALTDRWCGELPCDDDLNLRDEWRAAREALTCFEQLGVSGGALLVDGRVEAYSLGEMLNPQTAVIHMEKANRRLRGAYAAINREFVKARFSRIGYINREQDLGEEGLRRAKLSYHPHHLEMKYRVWMP